MSSTAATVATVRPRRLVASTTGTAKTTASRTGETLLVRRDGNDVLFLNELRHPRDPAITLRIPLDRVNVPAVMAARTLESPEDRLITIMITPLMS